MSTLKIARRVTDIRISPSLAASQKARDLKAAGRDIVDLTVGEPDFDTPAAVCRAGIAAIETGKTRYTPVNGTPELRHAIIADFATRGIAAAMDGICVGGGAKQILFLALMATVEQGDEVIVPAPYWVSYPDMVICNGGRPVIVECSAAQGFKLTPEALEAAITPATRWLILNTPSNPTGAAYTRAELQALGAVLQRHPQVWLLCDEIYDRIWFADFPALSIVAAVPELAERALVVNGVSKSHAMTGWRLGYGIGPKPLIDAVNKLQSQMSSCPSSISQAAAVVALTGEREDVSAMVAVYRERHDYVVGRLNAVPGLSCRPADGAFYLFPDCSGVMGKTTPDGKVLGTDEDFVLYLMDHAGVVSLQGAAYGLSPYFRISFSTSLELLTEACNRIEGACKALA